MTEPQLAFEKTAYFHTKRQDGHTETSVVTHADLNDTQLYLVGSMHPSSEQVANGFLAIDSTDAGYELSEVRLVPHDRLPLRRERTLAVLAQAAFRPMVLGGEKRAMVSVNLDKNDMDAKFFGEVLGMGKHVPEGKHTRGKRVRAFAQEVLHYSHEMMRDTGTISGPIPGDYGYIEPKAG